MFEFLQGFNFSEFIASSEIENDKSVFAFQRSIETIERILGTNRSRFGLFADILVSYLLIRFLPNLEANGYISLIQKFDRGNQMFSRCENNCIQTLVLVEEISQSARNTEQENQQVQSTEQVFLEFFKANQVAFRTQLKTMVENSFRRNAPGKRKQIRDLLRDLSDFEGLLNQPTWKQHQEISQTSKNPSIVAIQFYSNLCISNEGFREEIRKVSLTANFVSVFPTLRASRGWENFLRIFDAFFEERDRFYIEGGIPFELVLSNIK